MADPRPPLKSTKMNTSRSKADIDRAGPPPSVGTPRSRLYSDSPYHQDPPFPPYTPAEDPVHPPSSVGIRRSKLSSDSRYHQDPSFPPHVPPKAAQILGASDQQERGRAAGSSRSEQRQGGVNLHRLLKPPCTELAAGHPASSGQSSSFPYSPDSRIPVPDWPSSQPSRTATGLGSNTKESATQHRQNSTYPSSRLPVPLRSVERLIGRPEAQSGPTYQSHQLPRNEGKLASILGAATDRGGSRTSGALGRENPLDDIEALLDYSNKPASSTAIRHPFIQASPSLPDEANLSRHQNEGSTTRALLQKMAPKGAPPALPLGSKTETKSQPPLSPSALSPVAPRSPRSPPASPGRNGSVKPAMGQKKFKQESSTSQKVSHPTEPEDATSDLPPGSPITAIPQYPPSPTTSSPKHGRDASKSFFSNLKASRSTQRLNGTDSGSKASSKPDLTSRASSKDRNVYNSSRGHDSTPELQNFTSPDRGYGDTSGTEEVLEIRTGSGAEYQPLAENEPAVPMSSKKNKGKFGLLSRSRSIKLDDGAKSLKPAPKHRNLGGSDSEDHGANSDFQEPMKTAPLQPERDRTFWGSVNRNRSADRQLQYPQEDIISKSKKDKMPAAPNNLSSSANSPWSVSAAFKQAGSKAADGLGKTGKGFLNKMVRSGSSTEKEMLVEIPYICQVINLPLVEQTRRTRISKKLELSRDKTEFWMPALPWRCIDYLNANGCEEEGLYRVPGSGRDVKLWQKRFDTEFDINLFDQPELYDINTIGSLFKQWLRELPDEILPKETQARIAAECPAATTTPQFMKDELSRLPPFHYYLLFAITCHLSLLLSYKEINRMDYRNLCICFQPCMKIDHFCFTFLVCDWKNCWQGCWTEKEYLEEELRTRRDPNQAAKSNGKPTTAHSNGTADDRTISSSESNKHVVTESTPAKEPKLKPVTKDKANGGIVEEHAQQPAKNHQRRDSDRLSLGLAPLSPIRVEESAMSDPIRSAASSH